MRHCNTNIFALKMESKLVFRGFLNEWKMCSASWLKYLIAVVIHRDDNCHDEINKHTRVRRQCQETLINYSYVIDNQFDLKEKKYFKEKKLYVLYKQLISSQLCRVDNVTHCVSKIVPLNSFLSKDETFFLTSYFNSVTFNYGSILLGHFDLF